MLLTKKDDDGSSEALREKLNNLNADWTRLEKMVVEREQNLKQALDEAEAFGTEARAILDWLPSIEDRLRMKVKFFNRIYVNVFKYLFVGQVRGQERLTESCEADF